MRSHRRKSNTWERERLRMLKNVVSSHPCTRWQETERLQRAMSTHKDEEFDNSFLGLEVSRVDDKDRRRGSCGCCCHSNRRSSGRRHLCPFLDDFSGFSCQMNHGGIDERIEVILLKEREQGIRWLRKKKDIEGWGWVEERQTEGIYMREDVNPLLSIFSLLFFRWE